MKINWGTGIVIGMGLFMTFILYFVFRISTEEKYDYDLVTEEYYKKEMAYQTEIDAETNAHGLESLIIGAKTQEGWSLTFPDNLDYSKIEGTVFLYRPSNKALDFVLPISIIDGKMVIPHQKLISGRWNTIVDWTYKGKHFMFKKEITY